VLAIHGLGGSGRYWGGLADAVGDRFQILAPDLAGFGMSDRPANARYDRAQHLADLDAVIAEAGIEEPPIVVGHSLGGVLAALFAAGVGADDHGRDVGGLALAATPFPSADGVDHRGVLDDPDMARRRRVVEAIAAAWPVLHVPISMIRGYPREVVADFGRQDLRGRTFTLWSLWSDPAILQVLPAVERIGPAVPTLLAYARDDRTVGPSNGDRWAALLRHAERRAIEEGGHQFLLRSHFEVLADWLGASSDAGRS
jgi:pimeloyl-ACP methyl ester carboxylesterase